MNEAGLFTMGVSKELAVRDFLTQYALLLMNTILSTWDSCSIPEATTGAAHLIEVFGTERQKKALHG
jgi:hypothetical protein